MPLLTELETDPPRRLYKRQEMQQRPPNDRQEKSEEMKGTTSRQNLPTRGNTDVEYDLAINQNDKRRLKTLLKRKAKPPKECLIFAYDLGRVELLPILLDAGADPNAVGYQGSTIMGDCLVREDVAVLKLLLGRGADPNRGFAGTPAVVLAARSGNVEVLRLLIEAGASLSDDPRVAPNALFEAIGRGHTEVVRYLVAQGVSCRSRKPFGRTAIEYAAEKGTPEIEDLVRRRKHA